MTQSASGSLVVQPGAVLEDSSGNQWWISNAGQVVENGVTDALTDRVVAIGYLDGYIWQENADGLWWQKTGDGYGGWGQATSDPFPASPDGFVVTVSGYAPGIPDNLQSPDITPIVDSNGNTWWISPGGQVEVNGQADALTGRVIELAYKNGAVWQENADHLWWQYTGTGYDGWGGDGTYNNPVAVARTWLGGADNAASNPANWSPANTPQPGDVLYMTGGVMNVNGDDLAGDTVRLQGKSDGSATSYTFNLSGQVSMSLADDSPYGYGPAVVNLADGGQWTGGISAGPYGSGVTVQGNGLFANTSSYIDNVVTINAEVTGSGSFNVNEAHGIARLEFMHGVSDGQSVSINGYAEYGGQFGKVEVDDPAIFHASVTLGYGELTFRGITADSYSLENDMLSLYVGPNVVETIPFSISTVPPDQNGPVNFGVSQTALGVIVHADGNGPHDWSSGTLLPVHAGA